MGEVSDVVGGSGLAFYAEVALVLFFLVFVAIVVYVLLRKDRGRWERARRLPLDDRGGGKEDEETRNDG